MNNKNNRGVSTKSLVVYALCIISFFILFIAGTYSFFKSSSIGQGTSMIVTTATLSLVYIDGNAIGGNEMYPGDSATKTFTVENTGTGITYYDIKYEVSENTFNPSSDLSYSLSSDNNGAIVPEVSFPTQDAYIATGIAINPHTIQTYVLTINFRETSINQDSNQGKIVNAKVIIDSPYAMTANVDFNGYIIDENGSALTGKTIVLHSDPVSTISDENGYFEFGKVKTGIHNFKVLDGETELVNKDIKILSSLSQTEIKLDTIALYNSPVTINTHSLNFINIYYINFEFTNDSMAPIRHSTLYGSHISFTITPPVGYSLNGATISCPSGISSAINTTTGEVTVSNVTNSGTCNINLPLITYPIATAIQQKYTAQSDTNIIFSYTSAGCNDSTSCAAGTVEDASQVTNGLYINNKQNISGDPTQGQIKYFRGNVNNYVQMGTYQETLYFSAGMTYKHDVLSGFVYNSLTSCEAAHGAGNCEIYATEGEPIIWRVIRIDNDNTVRIITDKTAIPTSCYSYNCTNSNPMYVGYTINDTNTNRTDGNMGTDSQLKSLLDTWYAENLAEEYGSKIKQNAEYCNDTTSVQEGSNVFFIPRGRTYNAQTPTFSCPTTNKTYGGLYQLPIATITSDEEAYAGGRYKAVNQSYFLNNYTGYWTLTPCQYYSTWGTDMWTTSSGYVEAYNSSNNLSARPVVTLNANVQVSGEGTSTSPWIVQ